MPPHLASIGVVSAMDVGRALGSKDSATLWYGSGFFSGNEESVPPTVSTAWRVWSSCLCKICAPLGGEEVNMRLFKLY